MTRVAQLLLVLAAAGLWAASRLTWVQVTSFDGLGQPKTADLSGATWSTALVPLALLVLAAAGAALAVRGWPLRVLAVLVAAASAGMGYLAISLWVMADDAVRAARLADVPVADLLDTQRHYGGAVVTLVAAVLSLGGAVLLVRSATHRRAEAARYTRRPPAKSDTRAAAMSERMIWDALDEGHDPTNPDNQGR
ncbi:TIGR02234 family membrane protein [Mycolicibacterium austroafricanum]|uniref:TIGR02234 family membrane protein n=1 Tax=Mycolicibacterium austroafricanum TaxID=39687 RepID=UPI001CA3501B|nr:TIGR02234 family membrane protein [Mycolicibacterium austroafricanum]QZT64708.1 TIGR02234 family membrane protein [Mycolicibacterium austroafricanum]